jgi:two-component system chemotaxis response regulator CheY
MNKPRFETLKVLLVDDENLVRHLIKSVLRLAGVREIYEADNVDAAWEILNRREVHLILSDIGMEPKSGIDFVHTLRQSDKARIKRLPFIFLTAKDDQDTVSLAIRSGANAYILKNNLSPATLTARLTAVLTRPAAEQTPT